METALFGIPYLGICLDLLILVALLVTGMPAPFAFMGALVFLIYLYGFNPGALLSYAFWKLSSLTLLAVPFFIMAGAFMSVVGIAPRLISISNALVGRITGGLGAVVVVVCAMVGAIAGTCSAAVAAVGATLIPEMEQRGYPRGYSTGVVACASVLGQLIPPSVPMILYGFVARQSIAACFLSTIVPAVILVIIYIIINYFMTRGNPNIEKLPSVGIRRQAKELAVVSYRGFFALLMPVILLGSIYGGIMTPTEAAASTLVYAILIGLLVYRTVNITGLGKTFVTSITTTGVSMMMIFFVVILSRVLTMLNIPQQLISVLTGISENKYIVLLMVNVFLVFLGMLVDDFTGTMLAAPLLLPLMTHIGIHPIHFAAILGTNLGLGNVTPPTAPILYLAARIGDVSVDKMMKTALVFMIFGTIPVVLLTTYLPELSLTLPRLLMPRAMGVGG